MRPANIAPERVWLEDDESIRLNRGEYEAVRCLLGAVNYAAHANDDLQKRLMIIPGGQQRMTDALQELRNITDDVIGTVPSGQCRQLKNTMTDMDIRMVPKLAPMSRNVILDKDTAKELIDIAMERCHGCVEGHEDGRKCALYKVLEGFLPLDNYDNGMLCPYSMSEWKD